LKNPRILVVTLEQDDKMGMSIYPGKDCARFEGG
jgi:hypothetical protein